MAKYRYLLEAASTVQPMASNSLSCLMKPLLGLVTGLSLASSVIASVTLSDLDTIIQARITVALLLTPCLKIYTYHRSRLLSSLPSYLQCTKSFPTDSSHSEARYNKIQMGIKSKVHS